MPHKLPGGLYALVDDSVRPELPMVEKARLVISAGVGVLQLRMERTADREAVEVVRAVVARAGATRVIVNDRVDWALVGGAHGVHLGADDLPVPEARKILGPDALIGATTRSLEDIVRAKEQGADHVGLGPIFATRTKTVDHALLGLEGLARIAKEAPLPIVAIAGISLETIGPVAASGARCAAVAGALFQGADVVEQVRALQGAFAAGVQRGPN